jgi:hypothetical protein
VYCLALHSVPARARNPPTRDAREARSSSERSFECGASPCWIRPGTSLRASERLPEVPEQDARATTLENVRPDIRPQLREYLAWYEEVLGRVESGAVVAPGEQERLTEEASAVAHLLDLLDSSADEPAS